MREDVAAPGGWSRRAMMAGLAGSGSWIMMGGAALAASPKGDDRVEAAHVRQNVGPGRTLAMYLAVPGHTRGRKPAVLIVHDAAGLTPEAQAIARQVARLGYVACAPDLLSRVGGTPAEAGAAKIVTASLDPTQAGYDLAAAAGWLAHNPPGRRVLTGRVAAIGLGWGAALVGQAIAESGSVLGAALLCGGDASAIREDVPVLRLGRSALDSNGTGGWPAAAAFLHAHLRPDRA